MWETGDGKVKGKFTLPALAGGMLKKALMSMAAPKHQRANGETYDHERPTHHRLGQAFAEYVSRYPADKLPHAGGINATVVVTMDLDTLLGGLKAATVDTGSRLSAGAVRRLACEAGIVPAVLDGPSRVLDLGRLSRFHTEAQRLALAITQKHCQTPDLRRPRLAVPRPPQEALEPRRQDQPERRRHPLPPPPHPRPPRPTESAETNVRSVQMPAWPTPSPTAVPFDCPRRLAATRQGRAEPAARHRRAASASIARMSDAPESVWIFHGDGARHAAGVFASKEQALAWVERHSLTGLVTEYPVGIGAFDDAVARGRFKPSRDHHGTPQHIAAFSPGHTEHLHVVDGHVAG